MKRIIERQITLMIILVTIIITIAVRGNGQVLTTHSDTWDHMILLWGRI